ncbi:MAG TPA: RHS repeat domain-containing protein [Blastocatellia bacterium]|nr:RHS repeat domain-containing protein [Blastocatellia bacterium]
MENIYDNLGRLWKQSRPYREGVDAKQWTEFEYDSLDRPFKVRTPDQSMAQSFYNEVSSPSAATSNTGQTMRSRDAWGRERWVRFDEQNRLVEVVEPDPSGDGSVASGGMSTQYSYDTLGNLIQVNQGGQIRRFRYDSLGRLTHQKLAERDATLDDGGNWVGAGTWSDVFHYDNRSNLIWKKDARGVITQFEYNNDPLNRLQYVRYIQNQMPPELQGTVLEASDIGYEYMTSAPGDKMRVKTVNVLTGTDGLGSQQISYDIEGRVSEVRETSRGGNFLYTN